MKNIPFTKIFLQVDNGFGDLKGTGLAVEYDIGKNCLIWRTLDKRSMDSAKIPFKKPMTIGSAAGFSGLFVYISRNGALATAEERLGDSYIIVPILIGILLFLIIEYLITRNRNSYQIIEPPNCNEQLAHFDEIYEAIIKYNRGYVWTRQLVYNKKDSAQKFKIPYANLVFILILLSLVIIMIFNFVYPNPQTSGTFLICISVLSILFASILAIVWHGFITGIVFYKIFKKIRKNAGLHDNNDIA